MNDYVAIGPFAFGKGDSIKEALRNMRINVPTFVKKGYSYTVYKIEGDYSISHADGSITQPAGDPPPVIVEKHTYEPKPGEKALNG